ncbi:serine hydrolase domain-containing protein [Mucilaginibacter aquaedulcis]|jgi:CubicO group peptidase (beta-lactamase class C family)|uniref:serine hydrolase domain-containing protein n=1 Tax=Mucilaginibacter aquaedulcis TaxID=1187081 RepID=UPI0025B42DC8|nr:serine hydrolase [Mucilaginibacter aquaedulcis]MDN3546953.1 serine hydrolase [Mucilaginibacter aquaedulcis]
MKIKLNKPLPLKRLTLVLMCMMLVPVFSQAQSHKATKGASALSKYAKIDSIIRHFEAQGCFTGIVSISEKNVMTYNKAWGMASKELGVKNETYTKFEIGSISKQFCAALILMAESEGKIVLDSALKKYLPYTAKAASGLGNVTIHQLLAMRSGIPSYDNFPNFITGVGRKIYTHEEFIMDQCAYPIAPAPGTAFDYSDGNYYILGAVVEKLYGKKYHEVLSEKIFKPLKMNDSGFLLESAYPNGGDTVKNLGDGYQPITSKYDSLGLPIASKYQRGAWINMSDIAFSSGAIYMTGADFTKWAIALKNSTILPEKYTKQMFTEYSYDNVLTNYYPTKKGCPPTGYGYAMVITHRPPLPGDSKPLKIYTHGGLTPGYASVGAIVDGHDITVFINANINSDAPLVMCTEIINTLLGVPPNYGGLP